ncbi:MAG: hypothetical protein LLF28_06265 [Nitrospiraceae bacterium]|nr:hypothetical protein [Nitrospiraceae bacterium]
MDLKLLQNTGKELLKEISLFKNLDEPQIPLGIGAAGDKTFPVDKKAEEIIISAFEKSGEPFTIVSEEAGMMNINGGGRKVLIDPIDGSKNAVNGLPFYCASIAIADGNTIGNIETAYIINLSNGDEFWSNKGSGAFFNNKRIYTQKNNIFYFTAYESELPKRDIPKIMPLLAESMKVRCFGATALDLAYLAKGSISIFATPALSRSFDFGGGWLLVKEAGGVFTDISGNSIENKEISIKKTASLLVSGNEELHKKALKLLASQSL